MTTACRAAPVLLVWATAPSNVDSLTGPRFGNVFRNESRADPFGLRGPTKVGAVPYPSQLDRFGGPANVARASAHYEQGEGENVPEAVGKEPPPNNS